LSTEKKALEDALEAQQAGQAEFVANVMGGMETLVKMEMAKLTQMSSDQFSSLKNGNAKITDSNNALENQINTDSESAAQRNAAAQANVKAWGTAVQAVHANVQELESQNQETSAHVDSLSESFQEHMIELDSQTKSWGEANRQVGAAIVSASEQNKSVVAEITQMEQVHDESTSAMVQASQAWGASNRSVVEMMEGANAQNEETKQALDAASSRLAGHHDTALGLVGSWGDSDRSCQHSMAAAIEDGGRMSHDIVTKHEEFAQSSAAALQETRKLQEGVQTSSESVAAINSQGESCDTQLNNTSANIVEAMGGLLNTAETCGDEAQAVVRSQQGAVEAMIAPRAELMEAVVAEHKDIQACVSTTREQVRSKITAQGTEVNETVSMHKSNVTSLTVGHSNSCETLAVDTRQAIDAVTDMSKTGIEELSELKSSSVRELQTLTEEVVQGHEEHQSGISGCIANLNTYGLEVAKMECPVEGTVARVNHEYSAQFSATPSDEELHQEFNGGNCSFQFSAVKYSAQGEAMRGELVDEEEAPTEDVVEEPKSAALPKVKSSAKASKIKMLGGNPGSSTKMKLPTSASRPRTTVA